CLPGPLLPRRLWPMVRNSIRRVSRLWVAARATKSSTRLSSFAVVASGLAIAFAWAEHHAPPRMIPIVVPVLVPSAPAAEDQAADREQPDEEQERPAGPLEPADWDQLELLDDAEAKAAFQADPPPGFRDREDDHGSSDDVHLVMPSAHGPVA